MGKRSTFDRIPKDLYRTWDVRAVRPLLPFLAKGLRYVEPCAGAGDLIGLLAGHATCVLASDIEPLSDGIVVGDMMAATIGDADAFITNPPWTRKLLHPLIVHLSDQGTAWLLFDANWAFTKQAGPFMDRIRKIVVVGRLRWIPGTKDDGKDDAAWYELGPPIPGSRPTFYAQGCGPDTEARARRLCHDCGRVIGNRGRWKLAKRAGFITVVHRRCDMPNSQNESDPMPLIDFIEKGGAPQTPSPGI